MSCLIVSVAFLLDKNYRAFEAKQLQPLKNLDELSHSGGANDFRRGIEPSHGHQDRRKTIVRELGIVAVNSLNKVDFAIQNDSGFPWHLSSVTPACRCLVVSSFEERVLPGGSLELDVQYKAASIVANDVRPIVIKFQEPYVPEFELVVSALVRKPLTVLPRSIDLGSISQQQKKSVSFVVENHTKEIWPNIALFPSISLEEYACVSNLKIEEITDCVLSNRNLGHLQRWNVTFDFGVSREFSQNTQATIDLVSIGTATENKDSVQLIFRTDKAVRSVPSVCSFGNVRIGEIQDKRLLLLVNQDYFFGESTSLNVAYRHESGPEVIRIGCLNAEKQHFILPVMLDATELHGSHSIEGKIVVRSSDDLGYILEIPVWGEVATYGL
jgi:hypothetical protein